MTGLGEHMSDETRAKISATKKKQALIRQPDKARATDTASYPFWGINVSAMTICQHDEHGRQVGKAEKVRDLQEARDICEARNYPERKGKV